MNFLKRAYLKAKLKDKRFLNLLKEYQGDEVVALDCETTGLNPKKDEILTIGAVIIKNNKILLSQSFEVMIQPTKKINKESIKIHLIRDCDLKEAIKPKEVIEKLLNFIQNRPIVGYYINFDKAIISRYTKQFIGIALPNKTIELSSMYYKRYRKSSPYEFVDLKFDTILKELNLPNLGKHDALNDAIMSALIYLKLKEMPEYKGAFS